MARSDEQLAQLAVHGDRHAMEELVTRYHPILIRFYIKVSRDPISSEDFAQSALIRMIEKIGKYRASPTSKFSSWLMALAYNLFIDDVRKKRPLPVEAPILESRADGRDDYSALADRQQITRLLDELPDEMRAMVVLRYYMDMDYKEIAKATRCDVKRVKWRLHDALEKLRKAARV